MVDSARATAAARSASRTGQSQSATATPAHPAQPSAPSPAIATSRCGHDHDDSNDSCSDPLTAQTVSTTPRSKAIATQQPVYVRRCRACGDVLAVVRGINQLVADLETLAAQTGRDLEDVAAALQDSADCLVDGADLNQQ